MKPLYMIVVGLVLLNGSCNTHADDQVALLLEKVTSAIAADIDEAETLVEEALVLAPDNPEVNFLCGRIMGQQASEAIFSALRYARKSLHCLKHAVELAPNEIRYRHGLLRFYLGAPFIAGGSESLAEAQVAIIKSLDAIEGAKAELALLTETGQKSQQLLLLAELRTAYTETSYFHFRHGLLLQADGQYDAAYEAFLAALNISDKQHAGKTLAAGWYLPSTNEESETAINALYQVGRNAVFSHTQIDVGTAALKKYVDVLQPHHNAPPVEWAYLRLAQLRALKGEYAEAEKYLTLSRVSDDPALQDIARQVASMPR